MAHGPSGWIQAEPQPVAVHRARNTRHDVGLEPRDDGPERDIGAHPLVFELQLAPRREYGAGGCARLLPHRDVLPHIPAVLRRRLDLSLCPAHALDAAPPVQWQQVQRHEAASRRQQLQYLGVLPRHSHRRSDSLPAPDTGHVLLLSFHRAHACRPADPGGPRIGLANHARLPGLPTLAHYPESASSAQLVDPRARCQLPATNAHSTDQARLHFRVC